MSATVFYAIGDIHGEAGKLERLHNAIVADMAETRVRAEIIYLGDYVDRGPDSRRVIDLVMTFQGDVARSDNASAIALLGNHERLMLDALDDPSGDADEDWLFNGGYQTIESYGLAADDPDWRAAIDPAHVAWLRALPTIHADPSSGLVFVHAGIEPSIYPACADAVRLWTRSDRFFDTWTWPERSELRGVRVIHGHTPTDDARPYVDARRINVDTGAVFGGPLTCAVLTRGQPDRFLYA
jgi:serine/threonine protein phosphatase 1